MRTSATLLLLSLLLASTGCGTIGIIQLKALPSDPIYGIISLRDLPSGHVINAMDVMSAKIGISHRELLHPLRPRPDLDAYMTYDISELDSSKIVGHMVKEFIPEHRVINPQRDLI